MGREKEKEKEERNERGEKRRKENGMEGRIRTGREEERKLMKKT